MPANDKRVVRVNNRSGFDKSFRNTLTANCGTLVPILVDEVIPGTKVNLRLNLAASMPPLVSDTYMNVRLRVEAFAVPHRLTMANFEDFFSDYPGSFIRVDDIPVYSFIDRKGCMPLIQLIIDPSDQTETAIAQKLIGKLGAGSLADYMGFPVNGAAQPANYYAPLAPFVAYHLIWQEWYRNPRVQRPAFAPDGDASIVYNGNQHVPAAVAPYCRYMYGLNGSQPSVNMADAVGDGLAYYLLADGEDILSLRQRNFGLDFFTAAMVEPQQGEPARVIIGENEGDPANGFTIASLRAQNSIQQFRERNNLTSPRYQQQLYARYGVAPSDGMLQRPALIGAASYDVYSHGVTSTATTGAVDEADIQHSNPFSGSLGSRAGNGFASGSDFIISGFEAKEPMYIFVLASLVPDVSYSQVTNPIFDRYKGLGSITDMANGILQNVGPEPILNKDIYPASAADAEGVFAYTDRYSKWMFKNNEVHGRFKYGYDLQRFVLQRYFSDVPEFGSEFLEIPKTYLDDVLQYTSEVYGFSYWLDVAFDYKVSMPLQEYAIPSLQDPGYEHGHSIVLRKNGQLL